MTAPDTAAHWLLRGATQVFSAPALILFGAFLGFAGLARESGVTAGQTVFMVATVWALPSKVVLAGAIASNGSLGATAFAVGLSAVRLMPMSAALMPDLRSEKTRSITLYLLAHMVAVTAWVMALERLPSVPRQHRTAFYGGMAGMLVLSNMALVALVYAWAEALPPLAAAALFFVTPIYFLTSLWGTSRDDASKIALASGVALLPLAHRVLPEFDILLAGLAAGLIGFAAHWRRARR